MRRSDDLVEKFFGIREGELTVQSHTVSALAERFGTPFFVYDQAVLQKNLAQLRSSFGNQFSIFYSMKANPDFRVIQYFVEHADGIEIASIGEYKKAIKCGCTPQKIIFAGPGKSNAELYQVIENGIGEIHAESKNELTRIDEIARRLDRRVQVCIRINPAEKNQGGAMRMGGLAAPFGIDEEKVPDVIKFAKQLSRITISGIHLFTGTQLLNAETLISQYKRFIELAAEVAEMNNAPIKSIDFGGGLGVPYFENESAIDLNSITDRLRALPELTKTFDLLKDARLIIEPGRFLTAEAGIYVSKVLEVKSSRDTSFVITDGGMHHHLAASGNLGQVIKRNFPIACVNKLNKSCELDYEVVGPLCTPLDRLGRKVKLPEICEDDLIGIFCSGAYARSASPTGFLSHPAPAEVFIDGDSISVRQIQISETSNG